MTISITSNNAALIAQRQVAENSDKLATSTSKISSGERYQNAGDNASAVAIGADLRIDVAGLRSAQVNASQGIAMAQTAESAVRQIGDLLVRLKALTIQSQSSQVSNVERAAIDSEYQSLLSEVDRISLDTQFNGSTLVNGETISVTDVNDLPGNVLTTGNGINSITFNQNKGDGAVKLNYDSTTRVFTATDLETGATQTITLTATPIQPGSTETLRFGAVGAEIIIDSSFDKTSDLGLANTASITNGTGVITPGSISMTGANIVSGVNAFDFGTFDSDAVTMSNFAAPNNITFSMTQNGTVFTATGVDLTSTGTKTVTLSDVSGNSVTIQFELGTAFDGNETAASLTMHEMAAMVASNEAQTTTRTFDFQVGSGLDDVDRVTMVLPSVTVDSLGLTGTNTLNAIAAQAAAPLLDVALITLGDSRAQLGAAQSRLEASANSLTSAIEQAEGARSTLLDVDIAEEITELTTTQALMEAGISVLSRANQNPERLLQLLR